MKRFAWIAGAATTGLLVGAAFVSTRGGAPAAQSRPAEEKTAPAPAPSPKIVRSPERLRSVAAVRRDIETVLGEMERPVAKSAKGARGAAEIGFLARSLETGETIASRRATELRSCASNAKLFTTAAALLALGPEFRFETRFLSDAPVRNGVLEGDLWVRGGGDPTLDAELSGAKGAAIVLEEVARALRMSGIARVRGAIVLDLRLFSGEAYHPGWPAKDRGKGHALDVGPLVVEHDRVTVSAHGEEGRAVLSIEPEGSPYPLLNAVVVTRAAKPALALRRMAAGELRVTGTVAPNGESTAVFYTLEPHAQFAAVLRAALARVGIDVEGGTRLAGAREPSPATALYVLSSELPLAEVVRRIDRTSDNLYADMLLKVLGAVRLGDGSFAGGVAAVRGVLEPLGIPSAGYGAVDGSGLARDSRLSAAATVALLEAMARSPVAEIYRSSLAGGGESPGTLRKRLRDLGERVRAKTGSLDGVSSLSGYVETPYGETIAFSCFETYDERGGSFKAEEDRIVRALASLSAP